MRVLVFSQAAWNTDNSFGNTVTNWFDGWEDTHFFHFYARQQKPNTDIIEKYYHVSAVEILKKAFKGKQAGEILNPADVVEKETANDSFAEQKQIAKLRKSPNEIIYWGMEMVWRSRKWINRTFEEFVEEADPDIIFAFATNPYILEGAFKFIKKKKPAVKVILWIADDILGEYERTSWYRRRYLRKEIDYCIGIADKLYGASIEMCEKYSQIYKKRITPLYKGCSFDEPVREKYNTPLRFVYAGNLLYGRDETLAEIASVIEQINTGTEEAILEIYTGTIITQELSEKLDKGTSSKIMGARPYEEIKRIMHDADVVLHVESFEKKEIDYVRYSFSTKIIDCLQSGAQVLGIGPGEVASIRYLKKVDGAIVADDVGQIENVVSGLIRHKDTLLINVKKTRQFAVKNHEIHEVQKRLRKDFQDLLTTNT